MIAIDYPWESSPLVVDDCGELRVKGIRGLARNRIRGAFKPGTEVVLIELETFNELNRRQYLNSVA